MSPRVSRRVRTDITLTVSTATTHTVSLNNGVEMPALGLGVMLLPGSPDETVAVEAAIAVGYRHVDTAAAYGNEREVGEAAMAKLTTVVAPTRANDRTRSTNRLLTGSSLSAFGRLVPTSPPEARNLGREPLSGLHVRDVEAATHPALWPRPTSCSVSRTLFAAVFEPIRLGY
jgi:hypothetical protein